MSQQPKEENELGLPESNEKIESNNSNDPQEPKTKKRRKKVVIGEC